MSLSVVHHFHSQKVTYVVCVFSQSNDDERDIPDENGEEAEDQINCEDKGQYLYARTGRILLCWQQQ